MKKIVLVAVLAAAMLMVPAFPKATEINDRAYLNCYSTTMKPSFTVEPTEITSDVLYDALVQQYPEVEHTLATNSTIERLWTGEESIDQKEYPTIWWIEARIVENGTWEQSCQMQTLLPIETAEVE